MNDDTPQLIGFSTGCFYKMGFHEPNRIVENVLKAGGKAIELQFFTLGDRVNYMEKLDLDLLSELDHISLHLSSKPLYKDDKETELIFDVQVKAFQKFGCVDSIIHPDRIADLEIVERYDSQLNILVENMDALKDDCRRPEELIRFDEFPRLLDLQHIYSHDQEMKDLHSYIPPKGLREVHISGLNSYPELHYPLYITKQDIIIEKCKSLELDKKIPIIIESVFDSPEQAARELEYIKERLF